MINSWTIGNRLPFFIEIKMKLRAILEGWWYTGRNAHQIWAEWAVWARWQILNGSQFLFHFNDKWLSVDNISWIYYQNCLDKKFLLIHLRDCCDTYILRLWENPKNMTGQLKRGEVAFESIFVPNCRVGPNKHVVTK